MLLMNKEIDGNKSKASLYRKNSNKPFVINGHWNVERYDLNERKREKKNTGHHDQS